MKRSSILLAAALCCCAAGGEISSVYTDLQGPQCKEQKRDQEAGATMSRCPGVGGWGLLVAYDDERMSVTLVAPDGKERPLNYWHTITTAFSTLGPKAEWRVERRNGKPVPVGLIVRVNAKGEKPRSYLAVAKLTAGETCVTQRVEPGADANQQARRFADTGSTAPCLKPLP